MLFKLLLLFIIVPLVELAILVYLGIFIGTWYTPILIVVVTGFMGALLARSQGIATLARIRSSLEQGLIPSDELFNGVLILIGGLVLLTPGILTDILGFALLVPPTRRAIGRLIRNWISRKLQSGEMYYWRMP